LCLAAEFHSILGVERIASRPVRGCEAPQAAPSSGRAGVSRLAESKLCSTQPTGGALELDKKLLRIR
jgi:hypothetical protein